MCPDIDETVGAINGFGLLQAVEHYPRKGAGTIKSFHFLHYTMQEFLAAFRVSTLPSEHQSSLMEKTFWDDCYNFMWMMFVGIVGIKSDVFVNFVSSKRMVYVRKSGIRIAENILSDKRKRLHVFQCYMEAKSSAGAPDVISNMFKDGKVIIDGVKLLPHHLSSLMTYMSNSSMQWRRLELRRCKITDVGMNVLEQFMSEGFSTLEYVDLHDNESSPWSVYCVIIRNCCMDRLTLCGDHGMKEYVNKMTKCLQNNTKFQSLKLKNITKEGFKPIFDVKTLQTLDLSNNDLSDDGATTLSDGIKSNNTLLEFNVSSNQITNVGAKKIGEAIQVNIALQKLDISNNKVADDGAAAISNSLKSNNLLQELNMSSNQITNVGAKKIGEAIQVNTTLQKLDIHSNRISDDGAAAISDGLKSNNTLLEFNMSSNQITNVGAKKIGEAIQVNTTLQKLNIYSNQVSDDGAAAISDGLKSNNTLLEFNMSSNQITNVGAKKIGEAIQVNIALQKLDISFNKVSDDGAAAISNSLKSNNSLQELNMSYNQITNEGAKKIAEAIKVNTTLHTLDIFQSNISDELSFNITVLTAMYHNNTLMKLKLPLVFGDDERRLVSSEVEKINKERTRQGISILTYQYR